VKYYRVPEQYDNLRRIDGSILVRNELYTAKELEKYRIPKSYLEEVEISRKKIYFFFGARFQRDDDAVSTNA
jgi:hypothetical protein